MGIGDLQSCSHFDLFCGFQKHELGLNKEMNEEEKWISRNDIETFMEGVSGRICLTAGVLDVNDRC